MATRSGLGCATRASFAIVQERKGKRINLSACVGLWALGGSANSQLRCDVIVSKFPKGQDKCKAQRVRVMHEITLCNRSTQPLNSTSVHFLHWAVQASLCSHMAALKFGEVLLMWQGLHSLLGMASLNEKASGGHECLREFLLRFRCLPLLADNPGYIADVNQMIQLLTILANMTFTAVMSGETGITELTTWMSEEEAVAGVLEPWEKLYGVIQRDPGHFRSVLAVCKSEIASLKAECNTSLTHVHDLISRIGSLLDQIHGGISDLLQPSRDH